MAHGRERVTATALLLVDQTAVGPGLKNGHVAMPPAPVRLEAN